MTLFAAIRCRHCGTFHLLGTQCDCRTKLPSVIIGEGGIDDQIRYAIRCVCGEDRVILDVQPHDQDYGRGVFPDGTKHFIVTSESSECECSSKCQWMDQVCWYKDLSVVIQMSRLQTTSLGNVIRQLRE
jgi:hypothetical protein